MNKNTVITIAILFAMILLIICFILFLWGILHLSKKYSEKLNTLRKQNDLPHTFILKSSIASFILSFINLSLFVGTFFMFRFILSKANWETFELTIPFVLAVSFFGIAILIEILGTVFAFVGFATRKLEIEGERLKYRNWFGHTVSFNSSMIRRYRILWIAGILPADFLHFTSADGKKHFACIYLSEYSRILLRKYFDKQGVFKHIK